MMMMVYYTYSYSVYELFPSPSVSKATQCITNSGQAQEYTWGTWWLRSRNTSCKPNDVHGQNTHILQSVLFLELLNTLHTI